MLFTYQLSPSPLLQKLNIKRKCDFVVIPTAYILGQRKKERRKMDQHQVLKGARTGVTSYLVLLTMLSNSLLFLLFLYIFCSAEKKKKKNQREKKADYAVQYELGRKVKRKWWCLVMAEAEGRGQRAEQEGPVRVSSSMNSIFIER